MDNWRNVGKYTIHGLKVGRISFWKSGPSEDLVKQRRNVRWNRNLKKFTQKHQTKLRSADMFQKLHEIKWLFSLCKTLRMVFFPKQCGNTWGSYGRCKKPGWLDRGGGRVAHRFHRYFRGFVLACSFRVWIFIVCGWLRPAWTGFVCKFS